MRNVLLTSVYTQSSGGGACTKLQLNKSSFVEIRHATRGDNHVIGRASYVQNKLGLKVLTFMLHTAPMISSTIQRTWHLRLHLVAVAESTGVGGVMDEVGVQRHIVWIGFSGFELVRLLFVSI